MQYPYQYRVRFLTAQASETMHLQAANAATAVAMAEEASRGPAGDFELLSVTLVPDTTSFSPGVALRER